MISTCDRDALARTTIKQRQKNVEDLERDLKIKFRVLGANGILRAKLSTITF